MTELKSPPDEFRQMDGQQVFQWAAGAMLTGINVVGVFWALLVKKPGTAGTRAYWLDAAGGFVLLLALSQNHWFPDCFAFQASFVLLAVMLWWHIAATMKSPTHVHTKCIGASRFPGKGHAPLTWEVVTGLLVACAFFLVGMAPYGLFIMFSAFCASFKEGLIEERDRLRSVQMADAMAEQEYMMHNFEQWKRGQCG